VAGTTRCIDAGHGVQRVHAVHEICSALHSLMGATMGKPALQDLSRIGLAAVEDV